MISYPKISVIIVNWNSGVQLNDCLDSLEKFGDNCIKQVIVVDNASIDNSLKNIKSLSCVTFIKNDINLGFGKACNIGAAIADGDYLLFLNPDSMIHSKTLSKSLNLMESISNASVGICGVQLINIRGEIARSCARFPNAISFVSHCLGIDKIFPGVGHIMSEWDHSNSREVDHVIGAFFLVRRNVFEQLEGFDEKFFVYLEDLDFSLRARQAGWKTTYFADVTAFHLGGGTSQQIKAKRLFYSIRSRLIYSDLHFKNSNYLLVLFSSLLIEPLSRSLYSIMRLSWSELKETWAAYFMLWMWILNISN